MSIIYLLKEQSWKGKEKLVWSDTGKSARIIRMLSDPEEIEFGGWKPTLDSAVQLASLKWPTHFPRIYEKDRQSTFYISHIDMESTPPTFTVQYVDAKR